MKSEATFALPTRADALFLGALLVVVTLFATTTSAQAKSASLGAPAAVQGELSDATTEQVKQKYSGIPMDVTSASQTGCQTLFLNLGPIFLDLLGLQVDLSEITLDMIAAPGPGNLLCGLVGILD